MPRSENTEEAERAMDAISRSKRKAAETLLARSHADAIGDAELVRAAAPASSPVSVRLSAPLLERLDRIAAAQHRKRGNLIQHVLWEFVRAHGAEPAD
jgi:hypothetical protein